MCSRWNKIGRAFERFIEVAGEDEFRRLAATCPALEAFPSAAALLAHLRDRPGSDRARDTILGELATAANRGGDTSQLAAALLWRAFWPGLCALLRYAIAVCHDEPNELAADLAEKFTSSIAHYTPERVNKVAVTLLWNARRDFWYSLKDRIEQARRERPFDSETERQSTVGPLADAVDAFNDLSVELGDDAELVIACLVEGLTTAEAAVRFGLGREAVKKRLQRAAARLRRDVSSLFDEDAVPSGGDPLLTTNRGTTMKTGQHGGRRIVRGWRSDENRRAPYPGGQLALSAVCRRQKAATRPAGTGGINPAPADALGAEHHGDRRTDVLFVTLAPPAQDQAGTVSGLVSYCDQCRRWGERGSEHVCGENWSEHLTPVLVTLARRLS